MLDKVAMIYSSRVWVDVRIVPASGETRTSLLTWLGNFIANSVARKPPNDDPINGLFDIKGLHESIEKLDKEIHRIFYG